MVPLILAAAAVDQTLALAVVADRELLFFLSQQLVTQEQQLAAQP
jgi:hypothetical protein